MRGSFYFPPFFSLGCALSSVKAASGPVGRGKESVCEWAWVGSGADGQAGIRERDYCGTKESRGCAAVGVES